MPQVGATSTTRKVVQDDPILLQVRARADGFHITLVGHEDTE